MRAEFGDRTIGGVVADSYARQFYPDVLAENNTHRFLYLRLLKKSAVAIYTRGLHQSLAFKLAEYLAAGLCIVSEPLLHELPVPLEAGVHYLPFTTHEECIRQCRWLLDNPAEAAAIRKANVCYYQRYVEPQSHVRLLLDRAFPK
jgi:hypothetical protein